MVSECKYRMCDKQLSNSMELQLHTAKAHSKAENIKIRDFKLQDQKKALKEYNFGKSIEDEKFKCSKCERIVSINEMTLLTRTFNIIFSIHANIELSFNFIMTRGLFLSKRTECIAPAVVGVANITCSRYECLLYCFDNVTIIC